MTTDMIVTAYKKHGEYVNAQCITKNIVYLADSTKYKNDSNK